MKEYPFDHSALTAEQRVREMRAIASQNGMTQEQLLHAAVKVHRKEIEKTTQEDEGEINTVLENHLPSEIEESINSVFSFFHRISDIPENLTVLFCRRHPRLALICFPLLIAAILSISLSDLNSSASRKKSTEPEKTQNENENENTKDEEYAKIIRVLREETEESERRAWRRLEDTESFARALGGFLQNPPRIDDLEGIIPDEDLPPYPGGLFGNPPGLPDDLPDVFPDDLPPPPPVPERTD